jgi:aspartyl protease family protein
MRLRMRFPAQAVEPSSRIDCPRRVRWLAAAIVGAVLPVPGPALGSWQAGAAVFDAGSAGLSREVLAASEGDQSRPPAPADATESAAGGSEETSARVDIPRDPSGNYFTMGQINNTAVRLLVDTGASTVVIPAGLAKRMGLQQGKSQSFKTGGGPVPHYLTQLDSLVIGPIQIRDVPAAINPSMNEDFVLLGMSALELLHWSQKEGQLTLSYQTRNAAARLPEPELRFKKPLRECMGSGRSIDRKTLDCLKGRSPPP